MSTVTKPETHHHEGMSVNAMRIAALGIVFGDIGTSPLYTLKTVMAQAGDNPGAPTVLGALSLIIWTMVVVTSIKYVYFAMKVDNGGEGGILALMSLLSEKVKRRPFIAALGLAGACLIYGDGAITPAISVLSAVEGFEMAVPGASSYTIPIAVTILLALFSLQAHGTARIGRLFGPVMCLWFAVIAILGIVGIAKHPGILLALNPLYGAHFLMNNGHEGFLMLGGVFLCVTGAEALYADMGHFGAKPIRFSWLYLVFPSLLLNYAGQSALVLEGASSQDHLFFKLCPDIMLLPLVLLATIATIIASQAIITGAFSMTRQAIQLGWLPRLKITQTSASGYGQIYVRMVNWLLMVVTIGLVVTFKKSDNLASAYGIAVAATMLATTILLFVAMREIWRWNLLKAGAVAAVFLLVDAVFFAANLSKVAEGGYIPLILGGIIYLAMIIWHRGMEIVSAYVEEIVVPVDKFLAMVEREKIARVPGTAIFMTRTTAHAPPVMAWHVKHNRALHEKLLVLTVTTDSIPYVHDDHRFKAQKLADNFWRATACYGFMERPNIPELLTQAHKHQCEIDLSDLTYYVGRETILPTNNKKGMPYWMEILFAGMQRNAVHASAYFNLPQDDLVEIGRQIAI